MFLKLILSSVIIILLFLTVPQWLRTPEYITPGESYPRGENEVGSSVRPISHKASYNAIVTKDLFMSTRTRYADGSVVANATSPRVSVTPPPATLLGTVLLHGEEVAIISFRGRTDGANHYMVGEQIDGYLVKEIGTNNVLLEKGGQLFEISLTPSDKEIEVSTTQKSSNNYSPLVPSIQRRLAPNRLRRGQKLQRVNGRTPPPL